MDHRTNTQHYGHGHRTTAVTGYRPGSTLTSPHAGSGRRRERERAGRLHARTHTHTASMCREAHVFVRESDRCSRLDTRES